jgi:hypothetical protein
MPLPRLWPATLALLWSVTSSRAGPASETPTSTPRVRDRIAAEQRANLPLSMDVRLKGGKMLKLKSAGGPGQEPISSDFRWVRP